jgi:pimeloyl-ACP methyl ester carboxylesterase
MSCGAPRAIEADGLRLRLHEWSGAGDRPTLLLHSIASHSHWWDWAAPHFAARGPVAALDFRGHGGSDWSPVGAYPFAGWVTDAQAALDALGWRAPLVIGHSLGGYVAALLAARHPMRVGALVIADMLTGWSEDMAARGRRQAERPVTTFPSAPAAAAGFRLAPPETRASAAMLAHLAEAGVAERGPGQWQWAFDRRVFLHPPIDPWPFLGGVLCPTLVVRGGASPFMDRDQMLRVATAVRQGQFAELRNAYHHLVLDDPAGFAALVMGWAPARA